MSLIAFRLSTKVHVGKELLKLKYLREKESCKQEYINDGEQTAFMSMYVFNVKCEQHALRSNCKENNNNKTTKTT